ncbi:MAG: type II secretion system protein [SAR202 cluster bacterium]|nr:type II secretion system protein [SAR202 cluster bacterium]
MKKFISQVARGQKGFTLIEMIMVVGIIAVLAAVIVPNIGRFIGSGEDGAKAAEWEAVQTAMNAMMADNAITGVTALGTGSTATSDWSALPAGTDAQPLANYLQDSNTTYFYCYDNLGQIQQQFEASDASKACS